MTFFIVHEASEKDVDRAVAAAKAAQPAWAATPIATRTKLFKKLAALVLEHEDELAKLEALSMGIPVSTYFHAHAFADNFEYFAEAGFNVQGTTSLNTPGFVNMTFRQPYGVVAAIIPWNVPLLFFAKKVAPALAVGNTVVLKSSEKAPLAVSDDPCKITERTLMCESVQELPILSRKQASLQEFLM